MSTIHSVLSSNDHINKIVDNAISNVFECYKIFIGLIAEESFTVYSNVEAEVLDSCEQIVSENFSVLCDTLKSISLRYPKAINTEVYKRFVDASKAVLRDDLMDCKDHTHILGKSYIYDRSNPSIGIHTRFDLYCGMLKHVDGIILSLQEAYRLYVKEDVSPECLSELGIFIDILEEELFTIYSIVRFSIVTMMNFLIEFASNPLTKYDLEEGRTSIKELEMCAFDLFTEASNFCKKLNIELNCLTTDSADIVFNKTYLIDSTVAKFSNSAKSTMLFEYSEWNDNIQEIICLMQ